MPNSPSSRSKKPVSPKQLAANRANAARSAGPRTPEGKARSAQNARRHGFAAADFAVVRLEDLQAVAKLREDLVAVFQPANSQELFALERIALAQHALLRAARLEAGLFTTCLNDALDPLGDPIVPMAVELAGDLEITRVQNRNFALADGFRRMVRQASTWNLFLRYQAQAERLYRRAVEDFERLRALRDDLPIEPILEGEIEEKETASAPLETNPLPPEDTAAPVPDVPGNASPPPGAGNRPSPAPARNFPDSVPGRPERRPCGPGSPGVKDGRSEIDDVLRPAMYESLTRT